jgi:hypothetical protein
MTAMNPARRRFLWALSLAPAVAWGAQERPSTPPPQPTPGMTRLPDTIPENPGPGGMTPAQRRMVLTEEQKNIRKDVERLFKLASELRDEVLRTDFFEVLPVQFIHKAGEIEKLAKKIKDLARG